MRKTPIQEPHDLEKGDTVWLKSGSKEMNVREIAMEQATVEWKKDDGSVGSYSVPVYALTKKKPKIRRF